MTMRMKVRLFETLMAALIISMEACGGGGSGSGGGGGGGGGQLQLQITTASQLPGTLYGHTYSATLTAINGQGALKWSMAPISATASYVDGLTIDPNTGVVSGPANFSGTCGFTATVTDSASHTAAKTFLITSTSPLVVAPTKAITMTEYSDLFPTGLDIQGGVQPLTYTIDSGSLPPGLRLDYSTGNILGSPYAGGVFVANIGVRDSYTPAEVGSQQVTITVNRPPLIMADSLPRQAAVNSPFLGTVVATGGTPPYTFAESGAAPPGLGTIDPGAGKIAGIPTTKGSYNFQVLVTDSSSPVQSVARLFFIDVISGLGRNDTMQTATPVNNGVYQLSISPYIDPPDKAPERFDQDYFKLVSVSGATVLLQTSAKASNPNNPLDTVLELVDGAGIRLNTCQLPGDNSNAFNSPCINDDIDSNTQDSELQVRVPGATNTATTFYARVLDWRGDARPDMMYALIVNGLVSPLAVQTLSPMPAARTKPYSQQLLALNGTGSITWTITSGSLPPGLSITSGGLITGTATTDGTYPFTVQVSDSSTPPQTATADLSIQVVEPIKITTSAVFPDACLNQPYSFTMQATGGVPPITWTFMSMNWLGIYLNQSTGVFSGTPLITGTFTGTVGAVDNTLQQDSQSISLTVTSCP